GGVPAVGHEEEVPSAVPLRRRELVGEELGGVERLVDVADQVQDPAEGDGLPLGVEASPLEVGDGLFEDRNRVRGSGLQLFAVEVALPRRDERPVDEMP